MENDPMRTPVTMISEANEKFCFDLYNVLSKKAGSIFYSPISLELILALVHMGAKGRTAQEVAGVLHLPSDRNLVKDGFNDLLRIFKQGENEIILRTASKIFTQNKYSILESFISDAESLLAEAEALDFENESDKSTLMINEWVQERTDNKIKNFIPHGILDHRTQLLLINAVYFKGKWEYPFPEHCTSPMPFHITLSETKELPMMRLEREFMYANLSDLKGQALQLPYQGNHLSMVILLPNEIDGLRELEDNLTKVDFLQLLNKMHLRKVNVILPKFKIEKEVQLNEILKQLGMETIFDERLADLSGITGNSNLCVSHILHKAFIEVSEEGTEAAAATGCVIRKKRALPQVTQFVADHPYLFVILHKDSNTILFCGRFC